MAARAVGAREESVAVPPVPVVHSEVSVKSFRVVDINGDLDGYPDTNETVNLFVTVRNPTRIQDLTNVVIELTTADPKIDCIIPSSATLASLPAGTEVEIPTLFRLHVHPNADRGGPPVTCNNPGGGGTCSNFVEVPGGCVSDGDCRRTALQGYSATINVSIRSDQYPESSPIYPDDPGPRPQRITLDLDLDSSNAPAPTTTFAEGFESGFGSFTFQNLDFNIATNTLSNGMRCQYNDPDFMNSNSYGDTECYLGFPAGQSPVNDWHVHLTTAPDGGRAFQGMRSLHYGKHTFYHGVGDPGLDTYGMSQMDAVQTASTINLAARLCRDDPAANKRACNSTADCAAVGGGPCISASPELSFKHQISLVDYRALLLSLGESADRAVVHALVAGSTVYQKLQPFENIYNAWGEDEFSNCLFDPMDDGNNEDSYFDPTDPNRFLGPSSTCFPEFVFSDLGNTNEPFDPTRVGEASDGPGLLGSLGTGTWVESRFDLSRFRGRSIKIRFLLTSIKGSLAQTWQEFFSWNPVPWDDGWYIDDVRVTQTLGTASPTVTLDNADNSALMPGNMDADARGDECDCAPSDPGAFALPGEVTGVRLGQDKLTLSWNSAAPGSGVATVHDVARGLLTGLPVGTGPGEACVASGISSSTVSDPASPGTDGGFWYLVRGRNVCGSGSYGYRSGGAERMTSTCP